MVVVGMERMLEDERGAASLEAIFGSLLLILLLLGGLELARAASLRLALGDGVWHAARYLAVYDPWNEGQAEQIVRDAVAANALGGEPSGVVVVVSDDGGRSFGHLITVEAEMDFTPLIPFLTPREVTLRAGHSLLVEVWP